MIENFAIKKKFFKQLDERQQRIFAGMEAKSLGRSGVRIVSEAFGIHAHTIRKGKKELSAWDESVEREVKEEQPKGVRKKGGGRKKR